VKNRFQSLPFKFNLQRYTEAWQFVCAVRRATSGVELFISSDRAGMVAAAAPTSLQAALAPTAVLGGGAFLGALDDLWVVGRALAPAEVARLHGARTLAPRFDGVAGRFSLVTTPSSATSGSAFRSSAWRGGAGDGTGLSRGSQSGKSSTCLASSQLFNANTVASPSSTPPGPYH
jgi:hypothetical protein